MQKKIRNVSDRTRKAVVDAYFDVLAYDNGGDDYRDMMPTPTAEQRALAEMLGYMIGATVIINRANNDELIDKHVVRGAFWDVAE